MKLVDHLKIANSNSDHLLIFFPSCQKIYWLQRLKLQYMSFYLVFCDNKLNFFEFWDIDRKKQDILRCHYGLWQIAIDIYHSEAAKPPLTVSAMTTKCPGSEGKSPLAMNTPQRTDKKPEG